jgi:hypothetical protein
MRHIFRRAPHPPPKKAVNHPVQLRRRTVRTCCGCGLPPPTTLRPCQSARASSVCSCFGRIQMIRGQASNHHFWFWIFRQSSRCTQQASQHSSLLTGRFVRFQCFENRPGCRYASRGSILTEWLASIAKRYSKRLRIVQFHQGYIKRFVFNQLLRSSILMCSSQRVCVNFVYPSISVYRAVTAFTNVQLSAFYSSVVKNRLYCDGKDSVARRSAQTVLFEVDTHM